MGVLNAAMRKIIEEQRLGFIATIDGDGRACVSPKATFVVVDDDHIAFGEIRSPNTVANIASCPEVELNFVNPLIRKGFRCRGNARFIAKDDAAYAGYAHLFATWGDLAQRINGIVLIALSEARIVTSPAYDMGATENELRAQWLEKFHNQSR